MNASQSMPVLAKKKKSAVSPTVGVKRALDVARRIVNEIGQGDFRRGDMLPPEQEMLSRYGVARATLREALRFLELQGVIRLKPGPGGGPLVCDPMPESFASTMALILQFLGAHYRALIEVRQALGPSTAARAAERATAGQISQMAASLDRLEKLKSDSPEYVEEHRRFHDLLAVSTGNPLIAFLTVSLHQITNASALGITYTPNEREYQLKAYQRILSAIRERNPELASAEMFRFMNRSDAYLEQRYPELMSKQISWGDAPVVSKRARGPNNRGPNNREKG